jgi:hypothetical protein
MTEQKLTNMNEQQPATSARHEPAHIRGWCGWRGWRGRMVNYSLIQSTFNQICGEAFQRMILRYPAPAAVALEVRTRYAHALAKS